MAISDKVKVGMVEYGTPATILVEFATIAAFAQCLGDRVQVMAAMTVIVVLLLFILVLCKAVSSADLDGVDDWWGGVIWVKSGGGRVARNPRSTDGGLAIMVATAAPIGAIVSLVSGCCAGLNALEVPAVVSLLTTLFITYAVTVRALHREHRKRGLAD